MHGWVLCFLRVVQNDMSFSYLIYFIAITMVSFKEFMCICGVFLILNTFLLTHAHYMAPPDRELQLKIEKKEN